VDLLSIIGLALGIGAIIFGQALEGGHLHTLLNGPALVIVFGGTFGAIMLQAPAATFMRALKILPWVFKPPAVAAQETIEKIVSWSHVARKEGLLGLEGMSEDEPDIFARKALQLMVDGNEPDTIRATMEVEMYTTEDRDMAAAKLYEGMGGYSPTIGIIGAVVGLIHVMGNLADPSALGSGIAAAFVATIYGVGLANLVFLPMGSKLKSYIQKQSQYRQMIIEGVIAIAEGENPMNIELRLRSYVS